MITRTESYDLVVCGGGLAGLCAAIAAARHGARTCLIHDRPVLGGNASSEVRVTVHGAACFHAYARETGIISEILTEERARNHEEVNENGWVNSVLDLVCYDLVQRTPNLVLHLNTSVVDTVLSDGVRTSSRHERRPPADTAAGYAARPACAEAPALRAVVARVANAETELIVEGRMFVDATGDALVADLAGCAWRMGSESRAETGEIHAPERASTDTMGNSIHLRARDIGRDAPFTPPAWAVKHEDPAYFYEQGRKPSDPRGGFWWIEIGVPWHTIHDAETIRHELTRHALGIWDWMKNRDPVMKERCRTYALDWIGQVPGKRESRRVIGLHWLTEHDLQTNVAFPDEVAFGGWFVDLHTPGGLLAPTSEPASAEGYKDDSEYAAKSYVGPYGIPLRSLIARDCANLLLAGRDISATHAALGTARVMGTTALMGQAVGTAAAWGLARGIAAHDLPAHAAPVQQALLRDGCFLPGIANRDDADLARRARARASSSALLHGTGPHDRWVANGQKDWALRHGDLRRVNAQWIAVDAQGRIDRVAACLANPTGAPATVRATLRRADAIWDYRRDTGPALATATLTVPPGDECWVEWEVALRGLAPGWVRLELADAPGLRWNGGGRLLPGHVAAFALSPTRLRRHSDGGPLAFRVWPGQACYGPEQVLSGITRPQRQTNLWRSDPAQPLPQELELAWDAPQRIAQVELTFPGHLLKEVHAEPPFFRDAQIPRDYRIEARVDGAWRTVLTVGGNYHRQRRHPLPAAVDADALRVVVTATNGDPSAAIYEVRCYAEAGRES